MVLWYLVKYYSKCFCEDICWMRCTFISVDFEESRLPSIMVVGLIQSAEGLHTK